VARGTAGRWRAAVAGGWGVVMMPGAQPGAPVSMTQAMTRVVGTVLRMSHAAARWEKWGWDQRDAGAGGGPGPGKLGQPVKFATACAPQLSVLHQQVCSTPGCLPEALICSRLPIWASRLSLGFVASALVAAGSFVCAPCSSWRRRRLAALVRPVRRVPTWPAGVARGGCGSSG
jgi:hypothetical protein